MVDLLWLGVVLLIVGIIIYALGARGVGGLTVNIGKFILILFVVIFLVTLLLRFL